MATRTKEEARAWFDAFWARTSSSYPGADPEHIFDAYFRGLCAGAFHQGVADSEFIANLSRSPRWQAAQLAAPLVVSDETAERPVDPDQLRALRTTVKPEAMLRHLESKGELSVIELRASFPNLTPFAVMSQLAFLLTEKKISTFKNEEGILMCKPTEPKPEEPK